MGIENPRPEEQDPAKTGRDPSQPIDPDESIDNPAEEEEGDDQDETGKVELPKN